MHASSHACGLLLQAAWHGLSVYDFCVLHYLYHAPSSRPIIRYRLKSGDANADGKVTVGLAALLHRLQWFIHVRAHGLWK